MQLSHIPPYFLDFGLKGLPGFLSHRVVIGYRSCTPAASLHLMCMPSGCIAHRRSPKMMQLRRPTTHKGNMFGHRCIQVARQTIIDPAAPRSTTAARRHRLDSLCLCSPYMLRHFAQKRQNTIFHPRSAFTTRKNREGMKTRVGCQASRPVLAAELGQRCKLISTGRGKQGRCFRCLAHNKAKTAREAEPGEEHHLHSAALGLKQNKGLHCQGDPGVREAAASLSTWQLWDTVSSCTQKVHGATCSWHMSHSL